MGQRTHLNCVPGHFGMRARWAPGGTKTTKTSVFRGSPGDQGGTMLDPKTELYGVKCRSYAVRGRRAAALLIGNGRAARTNPSWAGS